MSRRASSGRRNASAGFGFELAGSDSSMSAVVAVDGAIWYPVRRRLGQERANGNDWRDAERAHTQQPLFPTAGPRKGERNQQKEIPGTARIARHSPESTHAEWSGKELSMETLDRIIAEHPFFGGLNDAQVHLLAGC